MNSFAAKTFDQQLRFLADENKKLSVELSNMSKAQGNLYRFQEKVERQRTIYAQIAEIGHQFNRDLDFGRILEGLQRFIIDHLNFERVVLFFPCSNDEKLKVKMMGGYYDPKTQEKINQLVMDFSDPIFKLFDSGVTQIIFNENLPTAEMKTWASQLLMDEFIASSLGNGADGKSLGLLCMGTSRAHFQHHYRVEVDQENNALFSNITSQIVAAQNTVKFTQAVQQESAQVRRLLNNMRQAVFSIDSNCLVVEPVSNFTESIFGESLVGKNVVSTVFFDFCKDLESNSVLKTALTTVFGESDLQWELMESSLPKQIPFVTKDSSAAPKILKVAYSPIWDKAGLLEKIMFVVEDISALQKLEKQVLLEQTRLQIIQEIARNDILSLNRNFFDRAYSLYSESLKIAKTQLVQSEVFDELLGNLHTLKGNARMQGFSFLSKQIHMVESQVLEMKESQISSLLPLQLQLVFKSLETYGQVARTVFGLKNPFFSLGSNEQEQIASAQTIEVDAKSFKDLENILQKVSAPTPDQIKIQRALKQLLSFPVKDALHRFQPMAEEIALSLGKKIEFQAHDNDLRLDRKKIDVLQDAILHLIRNAIDHGIEHPQERIQSGKKEIGLLKIHCQQNHDQAIITLTDDGRGIDPEKMACVALKRHLVSVPEVKKMNDYQRRHLIFLPGFSSKEIVTDLSGRGIGLDFVQKQLNEIGAEIEIESKINHGAKFTITMPLPSQT